MLTLDNPSGCLHFARRRKPRNAPKPTIMNIIRTTIAAALSLVAMAAQAQHAVTLTIDNDNLATFAVLNTGTASIVAVELMAGSRTRDGAVFGAGTDGDLSWSHWAGTGRYSVTTLSMSVQDGGSDAFAVNLDGVWLSDIPYSPSVYSPFGYVGASATVSWADGFERVIPMSRGLGGGVFTFTDIAPVPAVPEPATPLLMLAGLLAVGFAARKTGGSK